MRYSPQEVTKFHRDNKTNKCGFLGVKWHRRMQRFQATIRCGTKKIYCGTAKSAEEAAQLYDAKARELYGATAVVNFDRKDNPMQTSDIPLIKAMLAWSPIDCGEGRAVVIQHPDKNNDARKLGMSYTIGACDAAWDHLTSAQRMMRLYVEAWHIACRDGVPLRAIHDALMSIPEYRETLSGEQFFTFIELQAAAQEISN